MVAYYNEFDPFAAAWLRELIKAGHIAPGDVDERSIEDVTPSDLAGYSQCHFFAGIGVWSYALRRAGWPDDRQVWTGSCPCQPFSAAGKGGAFADERHLWPAFHHLIRQCRPSVVFGEQVASKGGLAWLDLVSADMEGTDYAFGAVDTCAAGFGAPHIRQRLYWVADCCCSGLERRSRAIGRAVGAHRQVDSLRAVGRLADASHCAGFASQPWATIGRFPPEDRNFCSLRTNSDYSFWGNADYLGCRDGNFRPVESGTFPLVDGAPARVGRLRGYGNAIVAPQAQAFIEAYLETRGSR